MIELNITPPGNLGAMARALSLFPERMTLASKLALKNTMSSAKNAARLAVSRRYTVPSVAIQKLKLRTRGLSSTMSASGKRNALERFKVKPRKRLYPAPKGGVYAQVLNAGGGYIGKAFYSDRGVLFERLGAKRLPIWKLTTVSAPGMLKVPPVSSYIVEQIEKRLSSELEKAAAQVMAL